MTKKTTTNKSEKNTDLIFDKVNYQYIIAGVIMLLLGFILMSGTENILDFRKITLAPIVILIGIIVVIAGILKKAK
ncbi:MAG: hypothetical protein RI934_375 [Bacteroidota bacterium]|jgi:uncharacterized membrane protein YgdD (TMEM256/DUF423 family)